MHALWYLMPLAGLIHCRCCYSDLNLCMHEIQHLIVCPHVLVMSTHSACNRLNLSLCPAGLALLISAASNMPYATSKSSALSSVDIFSDRKDIPSYQKISKRFPFISMDIHRYPNGEYSQLAGHSLSVVPGHASSSGWSSLGFSHAGEICRPSPSSQGCRCGARDCDADSS